MCIGLVHLVYIQAILNLVNCYSTEHVTVTRCASSVLTLIHITSRCKT